MRNSGLKFICRDVYLRVERSNTPFTRGYNAGQVIRVPVAHGEGNYVADKKTLASDVRALAVVDGDHSTVGYVSIELIKKTLRAGRVRRDDVEAPAVADT